MTGHKDARVFAVVLVVATTVGLFLRLQHLRTESFWSDEVAQLDWTNQRLGPFLADRWERADPPLNDLIAWTWNGGLRRWAPRFALDEAAVRAPVVLFGVLAIPAIGLAAAAAFGHRSGAVAALLLAANPHHVRYSQEARMYALTVLLSTIAVGFLVRTLRNGRRRDGLAFGAMAAAASYAHFYALLSLTAAVGATFGTLWVSTRRSPRRQPQSTSSALRTLLQGELFGLALFLPYLFAVAFHVSHSPRGARPWLANLGSPGLRAAWSAAQEYGANQLSMVLAAVAPASVDRWLVVASLACLAFALIVGSLVRREDEPPALRLHLVAMALCPPLLVFVVSQFRPIYHQRYLLTILPALVALCVRGKPLAPFAAILAIPITVGVGIEPRYHGWLEKPDYRGAAREIAARCTADDVVEGGVIHRRPLQFYMRQIGGHCETYEPVDRSRELSAERGQWAESSSAALVPGSRRFVIESGGRLRSTIDVNQSAEEQSTARGGVRRRLVFSDRSASMLRVWLDEP